MPEYVVRQVVASCSLVVVCMWRLEYAVDPCTGSVLACKRSITSPKLSDRQCLPSRAVYTR